MTYSGKGRPPVLFVNGLKPCSRCKVKKPSEAFDRMKSSASGYHSVCKECRAAGILVGNQTPGRRSTRDSVLYTKYGIREDDYWDMWIKQEGRCAICRVYLLVLCQDHNHKTKQNRGLLCKECNFGLGKFDDDRDRLLAAAAYLLEWERYMQHKTEPPNYEPDPETGLVGVTSDVAAAGVSMVVKDDEETDEETAPAPVPAPAPAPAPPASSSDF